jgi:hypothetical protein
MISARPVPESIAQNILDENAIGSRGGKRPSVHAGERADGGRVVGRRTGNMKDTLLGTRGRVRNLNNVP